MQNILHHVYVYQHSLYIIVITKYNHLKIHIIKLSRTTLPYIQTKQKVYVIAITHLQENPKTITCFKQKVISSKVNILTQSLSSLHLCHVYDHQASTH